MSALVLALLLSQDPAPALPEGLVPPTANCPSLPEYPSSEKATGVKGTVVLAVSLDETGKVTKIEVAQPMGPAFDAAALETAKSCTFTGATMNGKPVASIVQLTAPFEPPLKPWTLDGDVVGELGEAIEGAQVSFGGQSTLTDKNGHFALTFEGVPPGDAWVLVTHAGHADKAFPEVFKAGLTTRVRYALPKEKVYETRVEGSRLLPPVPEPDKTPQVSRFTITRADLDRTPGAYEDVARVAQQAPGVSADPDLLGTLFVRGGGPDEVVFYLDGVPLSNPYHLGGFVSIFNPMMIESAEFYTGGVPARYEPTLSGALEVHYAAPDTKKLRVLADVSMQTAMLRADIPLGIDGLSAIVSARRSYFEAYFAILRGLKIVGTNFVAPELTELLARVNFRRGRHQTTATYLFGSDGLDFNIQPGEAVLFAFTGNLELQNRLHLASLQHHIDLGGDSALNFTAAYTHDGNHFSVSGDNDRALDSQRDEFLVRADGVLASNERNRTQAGLQYAHRLLGISGGRIADPRPVAPWSQLPFVETFAGDFQFEPQLLRDMVSLYAEHTYRPIDAFTVEAGGRAQIDARSAEWSGSGRIAFAWTLPTATVVKVSAGVALQPVVSPVFLDPVGGNPNLVPERSWQVVAGIEQPLPFEALLRLELWGKWLDHLVVNPDTQGGVDALNAKGEPVFQNLGQGFARGADMLFVGRTRHFFYGLSMGFLLSDRTNPLAAERRTYPTPWDQHFTSALSLTWSPNDHWLITGRFSFRTGRPFTPVRGFTLDSATAEHDARWLPQLDGTNSDRYPPFYELSARAEYRFTLGPLKLAAYLEVMNITYAQNVFAYVYDAGNTDPAMLQEPQRGAFNHLPIRPFVGIRAEY